MTHSWRMNITMSFIIARVVKVFIKSSFYMLIFMSNLCIAEVKKNAKVVEVIKLDVKNVTQSVRLIGTIEAKKSSILTAKVSGTLDYRAHTGQKIAKGDLIAKLENADLEKAYTLSVSGEKNAEDQYVRIRDLEKRKLARKQDVEDRKNQWIEAQKTLNEAKRALEQTLFVAPFDGTVGGYKFREGAQVQVGDPIVNFYDPSDLIVTFDIPTDILKIIKTPYSHDHAQEQKVIIDGKKIIVPHIQRMIDPDTRMSPAYVNYSCPDCIVGSNIPLDFIVAKHTKVLVIPSEAMFMRDGKTYVYIVKDNKVEQRAVTPGIKGKDKLEISYGLELGDVVIFRGQERLSPGMEVTIAENPTSLPMNLAENSDLQKTATS